MSDTPGADVRQSPNASTLASLEPESVTALALAALALLDAINAGKLVATDTDTPALFKALYPSQDALRGASDALSAALAGFLSTVEGANRDSTKSQTVTTNNAPRYIVGAELCAPFAVVLKINTSKVTVEQFRVDLPRIAAKLESYLADSRADAAR